MKQWVEPREFREACSDARARGQRVVLVPTMGALHQGHLRLLERAKNHGDFVVISIFVNPTQFGPSEDYSRYPRPLERDLLLSSEAGAVGAFVPARDAMYPPHEQTRVVPGDLANHLCGPHRPHHFEGVTTIVSKLFALTGRCTAVFGRKDYQQLKIIERMSRDLFFPVSVVGCETVREPDGLAMSSRNAYLSAEQRERALSISSGLKSAQREFAKGERNASRIQSGVLETIRKHATSIDYVAVADPESLENMGEGDISNQALLAVAARFDGTRLIDNVVLGSDALIGGDT